MDVELTPTQARAIAQLRWRHPGAHVRTHAVVWGLIVEVRRHGRVAEVLALDTEGHVLPERRIGLAA